MRFVSKNRILWALTVLRILQGGLLVIPNITCFFYKVLSQLVVLKAAHGLGSSFTLKTEISLSLSTAVPAPVGCCPSSLCLRVNLTA